MDERAEIRARRVALGLSRPELGHLAGLSHESIRTAENTARPMNEATVGKILRALDDAEAKRASPGPAIDAALRAELEALRSEVAELSAAVFQLLEHERLTVGASGKQPGGLQGLQPRPAAPRPRT